MPSNINIYLVYINIANPSQDGSPHISMDAPRFPSLASARGQGAIKLSTDQILDRGPSPDTGEGDATLRLLLPLHWDGYLSPQSSEKLPATIFPLNLASYLYMY